MPLPALSQDYLGLTLAGNTTPERQLLAAMLDCAIRDACTRNKEHPERRPEALAWINDVLEIREWSFNWCCQELSLDPVVVRCLVTRSRDSR